MLAGIVPLHGQSSPIATDRPAITNSSVVVPSGSLQVENGLQTTTALGARTFDGPESLVVFGLTDATELRFTVPDYIHTAPGSGFGDLALGVKQQIGHTPSGFDVSLIVFLSFPTGATATSSHGYDPALQLPWSQKVSENWTAAGMFSLYWLTQSGARNLTGESTFLFDRQLTGSWDAFVEYAGDFRERGGRGTCCTSVQRTSWVRTNSLISTLERACLAQPWIISLASAIRFDSKSDGNE